MSNICSIINPTEKCRNTVIFRVQGVVKTKIVVLFFPQTNSSFIHTPTLKIFFLLIIRNPIKIGQICHLGIIYPISYHISSKPTKIKHFTHFPTQKSNFHLIKNPPTIPKLSLFISTFTDNYFSGKNYKLYHLYQCHTHHITLSHAPISSLNLTKSTQIHSKIPPMIKSLPKHKTSLFLSQDKYNPNMGATIKLYTKCKTNRE